MGEPDDLDIDVQFVRSAATQSFFCCIGMAHGLILSAVDSCVVTASDVWYRERRKKIGELSFVVCMAKNITQTKLL